MKKRKPPLVLGTVLVVALAAVAIWSAPKDQKSLMEQEMRAQREQQAKPDGKERAAEDRSVTSSSVRSAFSATGKPQARAGGPEGAAASMSIKMPPAQSEYKPTPNEAGVTSQWYVGK